MIRAIIIALCLLAFGAQAQSFFVGERPSVDKGKPPKPPTCSTFGWCLVETAANVTDSYTPIVPLSATTLRVYSNSNGSTPGNLYLRACTWQSCGPATMVLDVIDPRDTYIRTSGVAKGASGTYYAVLYTGDGYPTLGGYSPSWATSPDGVTWTWHGPITIFGRNQSSAAALIVDESRTDAYACMAWIDLAGGLLLMHAPMPCAPNQWTSDGVNVWPIAGEQPQFVTAAKTQHGYHLMGGPYATNRPLRHVFSCTGLPPWRVLETASAVGTGTTKGANLAVGVDDGYLHALTGNGSGGATHYRMPVTAYSC